MTIYTPKSDSQFKVTRSECGSYSRCQEQYSLPMPNSARELKWQNRYNELINFKSRVGHCNVPYRYDDNPILGTWVSTQRRNHKKMMKGNKTCMLQHHIHLLNEIGFVWELPPSGGPKYNDSKWLENFELLRKFRATYGHCRVPQVYPDNPKLGQWVHSQRIRYKRVINDILSTMDLVKNNNSIIEQRARALEEIGFVWQDQPMRYKYDDGSWMKQVDELLKFKSKYGHYRVPSGVPEYKSLRNWVKKQRYQYKLHCEGRISLMTKDRIDILDKIDFMGSK